MGWFGQHDVWIFDIMANIILNMDHDASCESWGFLMLRGAMKFDAQKLSAISTDQHRIAQLTFLPEFPHLLKELLKPVEERWGRGRVRPWHQLEFFGAISFFFTAKKLTPNPSLTFLRSPMETSWPVGYPEGPEV